MEIMEILNNGISFLEESLSSHDTVINCRERNRKFMWDHRWIFGQQKMKINRTELSQGKILIMDSDIHEAKFLNSMTT